MADEVTPGTDELLRAALGEVADQAGARTALPIVIPVREIADAVHKIYADVPRIPSAPELAEGTQLTWEAPQAYDPRTLPECEPSRVHLSVHNGLVGIVVREEEVGQDPMTAAVELPPGAARDFFLNGLAACLLAERHERVRLAEMAKQPLDLEAIPAEVLRQGKIDVD